MAFNTVPNSEVNKRIQDAQAVVFDVAQVCSVPVFKTIDAHSKAIGCPPAFIFFPLLTVIASCMGVKATIQVNEEWEEPAILWTVIAARKGEKKTPACKRLTTPITKLETEIQEGLQAAADVDEDRPTPNKLPPQLLVKYFSFEELFNLMDRSGCQILAIYDEVMALYQQLDLYKPTGSKIDKTTLLSLFNGASWNRNFKNNPNTFKMKSTAFNYSGFIQPKFLVEMLAREDHEGFSDRLMIACPAELLVPFKELQVPMPLDIVDLHDVFKSVRSLHSDSDDGLVYTFDDDALELFGEIHDSLQEQKASTTDDNRRGHIVKAITHVVRVAGIIHVMEQSFNGITDTWNRVINVASVEKAKKIVLYTLGQKFALMPPTAEDELRDANSDDGYIRRYSSTIVKFLSRSDFPMYPSTAHKYRLTPKMPNQTGKDAAAAFMERVKQLGFGDIVPCVGGNNKPTVKFLKRKYAELSEETLEHMKKMKMTRAMYESQSDQGRSDDKEAAGPSGIGNVRAEAGESSDDEN